MKVRRPFAALIHNKATGLDKINSLKQNGRLPWREE